MCWSRLAAEQSHAWSQWNLGLIYATGQGVPQDHAEAVKWYRLAAVRQKAGCFRSAGPGHRLFALQTAFEPQPSFTLR